jgi:type IV pilus assembly protein PilA
VRRKNKISFKQIERNRRKQMLMQMFHKRGKRGFTLVELLIVVAIIGVLSTIGVPTFRRMIQKSKKSEAKVNLGGIYTTEAAFFAEYNAYGNNLSRMGFEIDGAASTLIYRVGFMDAACAGVTTVLPSSGQNVAINAAFPAYYTMGNSSVGTSALLNNCAPQNSAADGTTFIAGAEGVISPTGNPATALDHDRWTINQSRIVSNTQDGVR